MTLNHETIPIKNDLINKLISAKGIKKEWLASSLGISRITLSRWVNGHVKTIKLKHLESLALYLGCEQGDLVRPEPSQRSLPEVLYEFLNHPQSRSLFYEGRMLGYENSFSEYLAVEAIELPEIFDRLLEFTDFLLIRKLFEQSSYLLCTLFPLIKRADYLFGLDRALSLDLKIKLQTEHVSDLEDFFRQDNYLNYHKLDYPLVVELQALGFWRSIGDFYLAKRVASDLLSKVPKSHALFGKLQWEALILAAEIRDWSSVARIFDWINEEFRVNESSDWWQASLVWDFYQERLTKDSLLSHVMVAPNLDYKNFKFMLEAILSKGGWPLMKEFWPRIGLAKECYPYQQYDYLLTDAYLGSESPNRVKIKEIIGSVDEQGMVKRMPLLMERFLL